MDACLRTRSLLCERRKPPCREGEIYCPCGPECYERFHLDHKLTTVDVQCGACHETTAITSEIETSLSDVLALSKFAYRKTLSCQSNELFVRVLIRG